MLSIRRPASMHLPGRDGKAALLNDLLSEPGWTSTSRRQSTKAVKSLLPVNESRMWAEVGRSF